MQYRADIDGLRAVAVLSVVIFHLDVPFFQGGFVGVDIFFVISGFLITSIIKHKHDNHNFQFADFYARRIRRLVPPLIATTAVTLLGAVFIMTPYDMVSFSRSAAAALFSLSNIAFYFESGYWDTASELKPLLHTWSLGVEEQFYLFWPALTVGLLSIQHRLSFGAALALISLLGAALCIWFTGIDQSAAFYLLPFRIFQFALGAMLIPLTPVLLKHTQMHSDKAANLAFWLGMICIVISVTTLSGDTLFPGWAVLLPTSGATLVLLGGALPGQLHTAARALMENRLSIWLGRVSYSLYLVHWPLVALFRYEYGAHLTVGDQLILAAATLLAACILHYGVERRFYQRDAAAADAKSDNTRFAVRTMALAGLLAVVCGNAWLGDGWAWRFPSTSLLEADITAGMQHRFLKDPEVCKLYDFPAHPVCDFDAATQVLILGDSHELDGVNFINAGYGADPTLNLIRFGNTNKCKNLEQKSGRFLTTDKRCQKSFDVLFDPITLANLDAVVYAANTPYAQKKRILLNILQAIKSGNPDIRIITLGGYIVTERPCGYYINKTHSTDACAYAENVAYFDNNPTTQPLFTDFKKIESHYIDRVALLCKNRVLQTCRTRTDDGTPALYDRHHASLEFAEMSGRMYAEKNPNLLHNSSTR